MFDMTNLTLRRTFPKSVRCGQKESTYHKQQHSKQTRITNNNTARKHVSQTTTQQASTITNNNTASKHVSQTTTQQANTYHKQQHSKQTRITNNNTASKHVSQTTTQQANTYHKQQHSKQTTLVYTVAKLNPECS
jgi:hypothetical protein